MTEPKIEITDLVDYPAIRQLSRALWRNGSVRGAAVLVGAGLSKNARRPSDDTPEPPLWWELKEAMVEQLYSHSTKAAPSNPLRIAEEYRALFDQAGLDEFIRTRFPDRAWSPGALHADLLELPWTDVLTTNWDTLLERASENTIEFSYEVVRKEADLTHARSPRIVKLHGSIGDSDPLIFAEQDYRGYPTNHAAFINLARQVFIENELCLLGFSGDDPNFAEWAGWVRDHLGASARRIHLVGCLRLERAGRRYLEARNIAPIDLAPLVNHLPRTEQHPSATRIFLEELKKARPASAKEWNQIPRSAFPLEAAGVDTFQRVVKEHALAAELLARAVPLLRADRKSYPGWLVCPAQKRSLLSDGRDETWLFRKPVFDLLRPEPRSEAVFELLWRHTIGFISPDARLIDAMTEILEAESSETEPSLRLKFAVSLMRYARLSYDDDSLIRWAALIEAETEPDASARQEAQYQRCLRARDRMDMEGLRAGLTLMTSDDPIWKLRRAALHTEIGEYVKATKLIKESAADLERRHRLDRNSLRIKSNLAWADWISRGSSLWEFSDRPSRVPRDFKDLDIDPLREIEHIENVVREIEKQRRGDERRSEPVPDAGQYRERTGNDAGHTSFALLYEFDQLSEFVGLPIRINRVNICADEAMAAVEIAYQPTFEWYVWLLRVLHSHFDPPFKRYFGDLAIAQLPAAVTVELTSGIEAAITFWKKSFKDARSPDFRDDRGCALDVLRLLLEALSRLTVRMSEDDAIRTFKLAIDLATDPDIWHNWLLEALIDLAKYAADAVSADRQGLLALGAMEFPLTPDGYGFSGASIVNSIWSSTPDRNPDDPRWSICVDRLIAATEKGHRSRVDASMRLSYLALRKALKADEATAFGRSLWSDLDGPDDDALPTNTRIVSSNFVDLPAGDGINARVRIQARLFTPDLRQIMLLPASSGTETIWKKHEHLISLWNAAHVDLTPPADIATRMFDEIVVWDEQDLDRRDPFAASIAKGFNDGIRSYAGAVLSAVVVPSMRTEDRTECRAQALLAFLRRTRSWRGLGALPYFVGCGPAAANDVLSAIRSGLVDSESQHVGSAAMAIINWAKIVRDGLLHELPRPLVEQLIATIETLREPGLHAMLSAALSLFKDDLLATDDLDRLMKVLEKIRVEFRYGNVAFDSARAESISLVRAESVKLAVALKNCITNDGALQAWIDEAGSDSSPKVRFSVANA